MRWIWIDRIIALEKGHRCVALKNISLAEEVLHDHFPAAGGRGVLPVMPNTLIIEGMAQTAGILVGHANDFREKVILAKIRQARFLQPAIPGFCLRHEAEISRLDASGASTSGRVDLLDPATGTRRTLAEIELLFSHVDRSLSGTDLPEHNFVFTGALMDLLKQGGLGSGSALAASRSAAEDRSQERL